MIQFLYTLGCVLGIFVPINLVTGRFFNLKLYKCYALIMLVGILTGYVISAVRRFNYTIPSQSLIITYMTMSSMLTMSNLCSVFVPSLLHPEKFHAFLTNSLKFGHFVNNSKKARYYAAQIIVGHIFVTAMCSLDYFTWTPLVGFNQYKDHFFRLIQTYHLYVEVMIMYHFLESIKSSFEHANKLLRVVPSRLPFMILSHQKVYAYDANINYVVELYEILLKQVRLFNALFGWQILFLVGTILAGFVRAFDVMLAYANVNQDNRIVKTNLIALTSLWSLVYMILGTIVAASCESTTKEAQRTADICYKLLLHLPAAPEKQHERALREQLYLLAQMATQRCPTFTAAGFFTVNYSMLLALFGSVTSYVIVVIQFNK